jgi:hypothetical protein
MHAETPHDAEPEADAIDAQAAKGRRRLWPWLAGIAIVCLSVLGVIVYSDAEPPDLSDLAFEPVAVAEADNLYFVLAKRGEALKTTPIIAEDASDEAEVARLAAEDAAELGGTIISSERLPSLRERLLNGEDWTSERLSRWGGSLDTLADEVSVLLKLPAMQAEAWSPSASSSRVGEIRELCQQVRLAAWARYHAGRQTEAVGTALDGFEVGLRLADAGGGFYEYNNALGLQGMFLDVLTDVAARPDVRPEMLRQIAKGLKRRPPGRDGYAHVLRNDSRIMVEQYRTLDANTVAGWRGRHWNPDVGPVRHIAGTRVLFPLVYKPNHTIALHADVIRRELAVHDLPKAERPRRSEDEFGGRIRAGGLARPANVLGRFLVELEANTYEGTALTRHLAFSRRGLVEAYVALRLYHRAHGELPESLDELVPEYLSAVPVDYVDREPLRYSRELRVLWSVGRKGLLVTSANPKIDDREVVALLDFAGPAAEEIKESR